MATKLDPGFQVSKTFNNPVMVLVVFPVSQQTVEDDSSSISAQYYIGMTALWAAVRCCVLSYKLYGSGPSVKELERYQLSMTSSWAPTRSDSICGAFPPVIGVHCLPELGISGRLQRVYNMPEHSDIQVIKCVGWSQKEQHCCNIDSSLFDN